MASEVERLTQELADCRQSIESFTSDNATLTANLKAANQEIDKLTKPAAKRQQKKDAADTKE